MRATLTHGVMCELSQSWALPNTLLTVTLTLVEGLQGEGLLGAELQSLQCGGMVQLYVIQLYIRVSVGEIRYHFRQHSVCLQS
jgi:hypothetical protein